MNIGINIGIKGWWFEVRITRIRGGKKRHENESWWFEVRITRIRGGEKRHWYESLWFEVRITQIRGGEARHEDDKCPKKLLFYFFKYNMTQKWQIITKNTKIMFVPEGCPRSAYVFQNMFLV